MSDGKFRIETRLDNKGVETDLKGLVGMVQRTSNNIKKAFNGASDNSSLKKQLAEQKNLLKEHESVLKSYQKRIDNIDNEAPVKAIKKKIEAENKIIENGKKKIDEYKAKMSELERSVSGMETAALENAKLGGAPGTQFDDSPKNLRKRANDQLSGNKDYQKMIDQEISLGQKIDEYSGKVRGAEEKVKDLGNSFSKVKETQTEALSTAMNDYGESVEKTKRKISSLQEALEKLKNKANISKSVDKNSSSLKKASRSATIFSNNVSKGAERGMNKLAKMGLAIFAVRSAYTFARKAASEYLASNEQLANQVTAIWNVVAQAIGPVVQTIIGWITTLIGYINAFIKSLTGVDLIAKGNAAALKKQADATAKTAKETAKANRQLAAFDEMNKLNSNDSSGSGSSVPQLSVNPINIDGLKDKLTKLFEPLKNAWANYGQSFVESFKYGLGQIWELIKSIGRSFEEVWLNGTGELTCSLILQILTDVFNIVGNIAKGFSEAWNKAGLGTSIIQHLWNILNNVLKVIKSITNFVNELVKKIDWTPILQGLDSILGLLDQLTEIGSHYFDEFLKSILNGDWSSAGQAISDVFKEQFKAIQDWLASIDWFQLGYDIAKFITDGLMNLIDMLLHVDWIGVVSSISTLILEAVMSASELLYGLIGGFLTSIWESITTALAPERFAKFLQGVVVAIFNAFMNIGQWFHDKFNEAYTFICNIFSPIGGWFEQRKQDIFNAFGSIGYWFSDTFGGAYATATIAFKDAGKFFSGVWSNIKGAFGNISEWFRSTFSKAWTAVKNVFSSGGKIFDGIKDGILNGLKAVINALISGINKVVSIPFNGINSALRSLKNINILGISPFGFLGTISVPQIPKLAKGGIVNNPGPGVNMGNYIAGEKGPEAVMPITDSQFIADFAEEIAKRIDTSQPINIVLKIGDKEFYKWFINMKKKYDFVMGG